METKSLKWLKNIGILSSFLTCVGLDPSARAGGFEYMPGPRFQSLRGLGMADAYLPVVDSGGEALFYQPAAIAKLEKTQFEAVNVSLRTNSDYFTNVGLDFYRILTPSAYTTNLNSHVMTSPSVGASALAAFAFRGFSLGVMYENNMMARSDGNGQIAYRSLLQFIPAAGVAVPLAGGIVRLGYSLQWVNKHEAQAYTTNFTSYQDGGLRGAGFSHTGGFQLTLPYKWEPSLNIVARNILGTTYSSGGFIPLASGSVVGTPRSEPMSFDASLSVHPKIGGGGRYSLILMGRDIFNLSQTSIFWRYGLGVEFNLWEKVFLRGGYMQYPSAGFGIKLKGMVIDFTWCTENLNGPGHVDDMQFRLGFRLGAI